MTDTTTAVAAGSKMPRLVNRYFLDKDAKSHPRATPAGITVVHEWKNGGYKLEMPLDKLSDDMKVCAMLFGISQVVGNAYGGETDQDEAQTKAENRWQALVNGTWATERESGPGNTDLVEAFARVYKDAGKPMSDEARTALAEKFTSGELDPKEAVKNPRVKAALDAIKAIRAQERAAKSAAAAKDAGELPAI